MAGTSNSITTKNKLVGKLNSGDNLFSGLVNTAYNPAYALATQAGAQITLFISSTDYKMYAQLKDKYGNTIFTSNVIDLPLETMVVNARYDSTTKEIVLILDNGNELRFSVADLVSGLISTDELNEILNDYVQFIDYATDNKGGVIKTSSTYGTTTTDNGQLISQTKTYSQYESLDNNAFISKGTLENVITGKELVDEDSIEEINDELFSNGVIEESGSNFITLDNLIETYPIDLKLKATEIEQETTSGKNLFNPNGIVNLATSNGTLVSSSNYIGYYIPVVAGEVYSLSRNELTNNRFAYCFTTEEPAKNVAYFGGTSTSAHTTDLKLENIVVPENANYLFIYLSNQADTLPTEIQLEKNSVATDYEPYTYGPTPNPNYPQDIHVISGDNTVLVTGSNLLKYNVRSSSTNGVNYNVDDKGQLTMTGTCTGNVGFGYNLSNNRITLEPGTYILNAIGETSNLKARIQGDYSSSYISTFPYTFTLTKSANINIESRCDSGKSYDINCYYTLTKGAIPTIERYIATECPINLPVENLAYTTWAEDFITRVNNSSRARLEIKDDRNCVYWTANLVNQDPETNYIFKIDWKPNTQYTFSFDIYSGSSAGNIRIGYADDTIGTISGLTSNAWNKTSFTSEAGKTIKYIYARNGSGGTYIDLDTFMVEENSKANTYQPYGTTPIEVCKIGDYEDKFFKAIDGDKVYDTLDNTTKESLTYGKWYLQNNVNKVKLKDITWDKRNTNERGISTYATTNDSSIEYPKILPPTYAYCNYFTIQNTVNGATAMYQRPIGIAQFYSSGITYDSRKTLYLNSTIDNVTDLNTFLANNDVEYYNTAYIPTYTLLNETLQQQLNNISSIYPYKEQTNILQNNNDLPFTINATGIKNNLNGIKEQNKEMEFIFNKTNELNEKSTDIQYPNAKVVYDSQKAQDNEIENLQAENAKLKNIINNIYDLENVLDSETIESSENISFNQTMNKAPLKMELKGSEIQQNTTTGANLQKYYVGSRTVSDVTMDITENGQITITGTASTGLTNYRINTADDLISLTAGTYVIKVIGSFVGTGPRLKVRGTEVSLDSNQEYTFTLNEDINDFYLSVIIGSGITCNSNFYITLAKDTPTTERYTNGASPSPDYPQDIHTVSGDNTIEVCGKNLLNIDNSNKLMASSGTNAIKSDNNVSITITGTSGYVLYLLGAINDYKGQTLTFSLKANINNVFKDCRFINCDSTGGNRANLGNTLGTENTSFSYSVPNETFTQDYLAMRLYVSGEANTTYLLENPMVEISASATSFEPYIRTIYPINLPVENLFDKDTMSTQIYSYISNLSTWSYSSESYSIRIPCKPNIEYTISANNPNETVFRAGVTDSDDIPVSGSSISIYSTTRYSNTEKPIYITTGTNAKYIVIQVSYSQASTTFNTLQIEEGSNANSYVPYEETPIELCKIGNYQDEFFKNTVDNKYYDSTLEFNKWYLKRKIGKIVFDGSESGWQQMTGTVSEYAFKNDSITQFMAMPTFPQTIYSNYFKPSTTGSATNSLDGDFWFNETGAGIRFKDKRIGTINDFKAWLGTHNTIVYAPLSIPTYTKIEGTLANQLEALNEANSYNQQTNLFQQNNDLSFTIEAKALIKF